MPTPFLWTNDDITCGQADKLTRQLAFLDRHGIPGVFFVIPRSGDRTLADDTDLLRVIDAGRGNGHEFYQHGYVHDPYESGVPPLWMLDFAPEVRRWYDTRRFELEATHTLEALTRMLENGRRIWRRAFHEDSAGYRPGWGAFCRNLYLGLELLGYEWVSSRLPAPTSWLWNQGRWDAPLAIDADVPFKPTRMGALVEFPIAGDYGFTVPNEIARIDAMADLGFREFEEFDHRGCPFLMVCHWHGLERNGDTGYAVHEKLIPRLLASGKAQPMGMVKLCKLAAGTAV